MEPICAIKDIYKILYQFEKNFSEDLRLYRSFKLPGLKGDHLCREQGVYPQEHQ